MSIWWWVISGVASGQCLQARPLVVQQPRGVVELAVADLDGNGAEDLLVAAADTGVVGWMAHQPSGLQPMRVIDDARVADQLAAGDLDQDGDLDVVASVVHDGQLGWYANLGDDHWGPFTPFDGGAWETGDLLVVDFDGDGLVDVLRSTGLDGAVLGYQNLGGGVLAAPVPVASGLGTAFALAWFDADGDGASDLVVGASTAVLAFPVLPGGQLGAEQRLVGVSDATRVVQLDVDGDGLMELAAVGREVLVLVWGDGGTEELHDDAVDFAFVDSNADGHPDLIASHTSGVLRSQLWSDQGFSPGMLFASSDGVFWPLATPAGVGARVYTSDDADHGDSLDRTDGIHRVGGGPGYPNLSALFTSQDTSRRSVLPFDMDGDGDRDIFLTADSLLQDDDNIWFERVPDGWIPHALVLGAEDFTVVPARLDDDGWADLVLIGNTEIAWRRGGPGGFDPPQSLVLPEGIAVSVPHAVVAQLDGDDRDEILLFADPLERVELDAAGMPVRTALSGPVPGLVLKLWDVVDVDGDGRDDLIMGVQAEGELDLHRQVDGGFGTAEPLYDPTPWTSTALEYLDLDGDQELEVLTTVDWAPAWYELDGSGPFLVPTPASMSNPRAHAVADLDGNGTLDLQISDWVAPYPGPGLSLGGTVYDAFLPTAWFAPLPVPGDVVLDVDGDGQLDPVAHREDGLWWNAPCSELADVPAAPAGTWEFPTEPGPDPADPTAPVDRESAKGGCGCQTGGTSPGWMLGLLPLLAGRRRR